jgi:hypothetical protein
MKKHYFESRSRGISYMKYVNERLPSTTGYSRKDKREIEVTGSRGRRRSKLLDELKERRGYCHLKEKALDRTMWRVRFGRGFGPVVRQTAK